MKCDRRWWNDGRVQIEQQPEPEPGAQFCVPQTPYVAAMPLDGRLVRCTVKSNADEAEFAEVLRRERDHQWATMWSEALRRRGDGKCEWPLAECEREKLPDAGKQPLL